MGLLYALERRTDCTDCSGAFIRCSFWLMIHSLNDAADQKPQKRFYKLSPKEGGNALQDCTVGNENKTAGSKISMPT